MKKMSIAWLLLAASAAYGQTEKTKPGVEVGLFSGQFLISTDLHSVYMNLIGAGYKYTRRHTTISFTVYPTLRFYDDPQPDKTEPRRPFITPGFAIGPLVQYKRVYLGLPAFYDSQYAKWRYTVGVGVK